MMPREVPTLPLHFGGALWLLLLGLYLGTAVSSYFFAAPALFDAVGTILRDSSEAGRLAGHVFDRQAAFSLAALIILLVLFPRRSLDRRRLATRAAILLLGLALTAVLAEMLLITPAIHSLRYELWQLYGSVQAAPSDDPTRRQFAMLHGVSMVRALVEMLCALAAFLLTATRGR